MDEVADSHRLSQPKRQRDAKGKLGQEWLATATERWNSLMKRTLGLVVGLTLLTGIVASCGSGDDNAVSTDTTAEAVSPDTTAQTVSSSPDNTSSTGSSGTSNTGNAKVDAFCNSASEVVASAEKADADEDSAAAEKAAQDARDLLKEVPGLTKEVVGDPSLASKVDDCADQLDRIS